MQEKLAVSNAYHTKKLSPMFIFHMVFSNVLPELAVAHISEFVLFPLVRYNFLKLNVEIWASVGKSCYHACCFGFPHIILNRSATLKKDGL